LNLRSEICFSERSEDMDPFFDASHDRLRAKARAWAEKHLQSGHRGDVSMEEEARSLVKQMGRDGLLAHTVPRRYGGARDRVHLRDICIVREELARRSSLADVMFAVQALASYPIILGGTEKQKGRYLPALAKGETIGAFALTEPEAGSDLAAMQTRAVKHGKAYVLNGLKHLISNAGLAETYVVFACTGPRKTKKHISAFVVEAGTAGLTLKERISLISPHPIGTLAFDDCRIPESQLISGGGDGLRIALATLETLRSGVGAAAVGLAERALEEAIGYTQRRRQFGQPLSRFQATRFTLADMATELAAARGLVHQAAWSRDLGQGDVAQSSSTAKLFATEAAQRIIDHALQLHGGLGLVSGAPVERLYRDIRALRIYEGTSEIQKIIIARTLLGDED